MTTVLRPAPVSLKRVPFWLYVLDLGLTQADIHLALGGFVASGDLTQLQAARMRIKINDAEEYLRNDPELLLMAQLLGLATNQNDLDAHFRNAANAG